MRYNKNFNTLNRIKEIADNANKIIPRLFFGNKNQINLTPLGKMCCYGLLYKVTVVLA